MLNSSSRLQNSLLRDCRNHSLREEYRNRPINENGASGIFGQRTAEMLAINQKDRLSLARARFTEMFRSTPPQSDPRLEIERFLRETSK
jgi:hypothetical protein